MLRFFNGVAPKSNLLRQSTLVLINPTPSSLSRSFSSLSLNVRHSTVSTESDADRRRALERYGLSKLGLVWPERSSSSVAVDYTNKNPTSVSQMYGAADLSKLPIFQGGFINFGYWPNPLATDGEITLAQRVECSKEMYRVLANLAAIFQTCSILEIGCGLGYGSTFLSQEYHPKLVVGMDISPDQIARAKRHQITEVAQGKLRFAIGEAESMPFTDHSFDQIISVEAAQHFDSIPAFSKETIRILKPGGKLVMTSFFPTTQEGVRALNAIVPDYHIHGSQNTVEEVEKEFSKHMDKVKVTSIGENVWEGFSKWLDQIGYNRQWSKIWPALYEKGLIDYVVYQAEAPHLAPASKLQRRAG